MPAGSELTSQAIQPGTTEYGTRQTLEQGLSDAMSSPPGPTGAPLTSGAAGVGGPVDPLGALMGGDVPTGDGPLTSGLSVGPGPSPAAQSTQMLPLQEKLLALAENAKSPRLRAQARLALRRLVRVNPT